MVPQDLSKVLNAQIPENPEELDLRFFSDIVLTDTYDGCGDPSDGMYYHAILYGNRIVYEWQKFYDHGEGHGSTSKGNPLYSKVAKAADIYLKIQKIARAKFFEGHPDGEHPSRDGWDMVYLDTENLQILENHPQYKQLIETMGVTLELATGFNSYKRTVQVSKRYNT